jgi:hypothetical protein
VQKFPNFESELGLSLSTSLESVIVCRAESSGAVAARTGGALSR